MTASSTPRRPRVAIVGRFQQGKSTLVNCLLDGRVAVTGVGLRTTCIETTYHFSEIEDVRIQVPHQAERRVALEAFLEAAARGLPAGSKARVGLWRPLLEHVDLIDTPGLDDNEQDDDVVRRVITEADRFIVVLPPIGTIHQCDKRLFAAIHGQGKRYSVLVNALKSPGTTDEITASVAAALGNMDFKPDPIMEQSVFACNFMWFWAGSGHLDRESDKVGRLEVWEDISRAHRGTTPERGHLAEASRFIEVRRALAKSVATAETLTFDAQLLLDHAEAKWRDALSAALRPN